MDFCEHGLACGATITANSTKYAQISSRNVLTQLIVPKCVKFDDHAVGPRHRGFPDLRWTQYEFMPKPMDSLQPVSPHQFHYSFYACRKKHPLFCRLHNCKKISAHSCGLLEKLPKRVQFLELGGDQTEDFFGIFAREIPAARMIVIYNLLALAGPTAFFFVYQFAMGHAGDLQNASVPLGITTSLLVIFWSYFIESLHSAGKDGLISE